MKNVLTKDDIDKKELVSGTNLAAWAKNHKDSKVISEDNCGVTIEGPRGTARIANDRYPRNAMERSVFWGHMRRIGLFCLILLMAGSFLLAAA